MKKNTPVLDMYYNYCRKGIRRKNGLCGRMRIAAPNEWPLFIPTYEELRRHEKDGYCPTYWGEKISIDVEDAGNDMTHLRQNIVLFIAAMRGEL